MTAEVELLREAVTRLRADAKPGNPNPWSNPLFLSHVADMLEREADELESVPYRVDTDWIERNYRDPLATARAYLGREA
ncbi:hypothetical protein ACGFIW_01995 [Micromonospora sp. NPDC048935]|uniref:hypothetical protein n=1 Tax=Micromonospora sp. NPDC048935 TaxID=3364262 RepID=UPI0037219415